MRDRVETVRGEVDEGLLVSRPGPLDELALHCSTPSERFDWCADLSWDADRADPFESHGGSRDQCRRASRPPACLGGSPAPDQSASAYRAKRPMAREAVSGSNPLRARSA